MRCYQCGQRGKPQGVTYTPKKRTPIVTFVCLNASCVFEYTNFDGEKARARPRWRFPLAWIK